MLLYHKLYEKMYLFCYTLWWKPNTVFINKSFSNVKIMVFPLRTSPKYPTFWEIENKATTTKRQKGTYLPFSTKSSTSNFSPFWTTVLIAGEIKGWIFFNIKICLDTRLIWFSHKSGVKASEFLVKLPSPHATGRYVPTRRGKGSSYLAPAVFLGAFSLPELLVFEGKNTN